MPAPAPLECDLRDLHDSRALGVAETSRYAPLANLLNAMGATRKPRVRCAPHSRNIGAGITEGGFFTPGQLIWQPDTALVPARLRRHHQQLPGDQQMTRLRRKAAARPRSRLTKPAKSARSPHRRLLLLEPALDAGYRAAQAEG